MKIKKRKKETALFILRLEKKRWTFWKHRRVGKGGKSLGTKSQMNGLTGWAGEGN